VLGEAGLLAKFNGKPSKKGTGFEQPPEVLGAFQPTGRDGCVLSIATPTSRIVMYRYRVWRMRPRKNGAGKKCMIDNPVWCSTGNQRFGVVTKKARPTRQISSKKRRLTVTASRVFKHRIAKNDIDLAIFELKSVSRFYWANEEKLNSLSWHRI
jgi:hypothetical protein